MTALTSLRSFTWIPAPDTRFQGNQGRPYLRFRTELRASAPQAVAATPWSPEPRPFGPRAPMVSFTGADPTRRGQCLSRLLRHLDLTAVALTGSMAILSHLTARGVLWPERQVDDIDFVASALDAVLPSVTTECLVSHFHRPHPGYSKFLVQLVDPVARLRIDVFPGLECQVRGAATAWVAGIPLPILELEGILDHKLATLARAASDHPVEEKHFHDAVRLGALCGRLVPDVRPERLCKGEYSLDLAARCSRCDASRDTRFPLAPKEQIFEVLGYV